MDAFLHALETERDHPPPVAPKKDFSVREFILADVINSLKAKANVDTRYSCSFAC